MPPTPSSTRLALPQLSDAVLADRAADGDPHAFAELVRRYGGVLRGYATRILGRTASSDDVVQEAFVTAWQQLDTLEDPAAVRAWLIRITTRKALDHLRASRDHEDIDDLEIAAAAAGPEARAEGSDMNVALSRALDALPATQRRTWILRELGGYSYDEIAVELGLPNSTVRGALSRARSTLLTELQGWR